MLAAAAADSSSCRARPPGAAAAGGVGALAILVRLVTVHATSTAFSVGTRRNHDEAFGSVRNLGAEINTSWHEAHPSVSDEWPANGATICFDSDRPMGEGRLDIWQATWIALEHCLLSGEGAERDCNQNELSDTCEIASGAVKDVDENGVPDECQSDCNTNEVPDAFETSTGAIPDCNGNSIPDDCEPDENRNDIADSCEPHFIRGDCDGDGEVLITDGLFLLNFLFPSRRTPDCKAACDPFVSGFLGTTTAVGIFEYLFLGGPAPVPPFPECGLGTETDNTLGCETSNCE